MRGREAAGQMPTSPTGKANRGFTLIELLVVVTLLAILSLGAALAAGRRGEGAASVGDRLQTTVAQARDAALFGRVRIGLLPRADGWQLLRQRAGEGWQALGGPVTMAGMALEWEVAGAPLALPAGTTPPIGFGPDGRATPFALRIAAGGMHCSGQPDGGLTCVAR